MANIKNAAVPHYSKYNGKIFFAVRVCPANTSIEPYTVYRRWDEFLDLSAKLATVFPSASPDPNDPSTIFRRIPRLSKKVTLFATASTHTSRRDELDLFVRHMVNLPRAVTSFPLVRDFFSIKMNGLDGRQPPSPNTSPSPAQSPHFESKLANQTLSRQGHQQTLQGQQVLKKKPSKQALQSSSQVQEPVQARAFRPTLAAKRSTPDLRRFVTSSSKDCFASSLEEEEQPPLPKPASQYPALDKFSFPPRKAPDCPTSNLPHTSGTRGPPPFASPPSSRPSSRDGYVSSVVTIPHASTSSDAASMRTNSTVRPGRAGSSTRMASPMSFVSITSEGSGQSTPMQSLASPATITRREGGSKHGSAPAPSLKHFRSLQDIRNVLAPHPQHPMLNASAQPTYTYTSAPPSGKASAPPQTPRADDSAHPAPSPVSQGLTRTRSDSKILLMTTLPSLVEDEVVSPIASPLGRTPSNGRRNAAGSAAPSMSRSFSADSVTPGSFPARRPSLNSIRRMQHSLAMTPTSQHQASSSMSSVASTDSGSSVSIARSQASSAGLGLAFSSSSCDSFDFSDHTLSTLNSPDSSLIIHSPITPFSAATKEEPFDKLFHQEQNDLLHRGLYGAVYTGQNVPPQLPFFPTPAAYDQMQSRRNSAGHRTRTSPLHQPVLETILGSPVMGSEIKDLTPMITLKIRTETTNFMLKMAKSSSLRDVKEKIVDKVKSSGIKLDPDFGLAFLAAGGPSSFDSTAKGWKASSNCKASASTDTEQLHIQLQDEEDWLLAVSLASTKMTLQVCA